MLTGRVAYAAAEPFLWSSLTVAETLEFPGRPYRASTSPIGISLASSATVQRVGEVERVPLADPATRGPTQDPGRACWHLVGLNSPQVCGKTTVRTVTVDLSFSTGPQPDAHSRLRIDRWQEIQLTPCAGPAVSGSASTSPYG